MDFSKICGFPTFLSQPSRAQHLCETKDHFSLRRYITPIFVIGLSIERPILDHHPKAHIHEIREIRKIREIRRISPVKSGGFHPWSGGFHEIRKIREIRRISPWNPADFMKSVKSGGFHPWNLADFTQISPVKSTQNYKSKCFSKNSSVWWMQGGGFHPWNPPDFTLKSGGISPVKSSGFHPDFTCEIHPKL